MSEDAFIEITVDLCYMACQTNEDRGDLSPSIYTIENYSTVKKLAINCLEYISNEYKKEFISEDSDFENHMAYNLWLEYVDEYWYTESLLNFEEFLGEYFGE